MWRPLLLVVLACWFAAASAQPYPAKPIRLITGSSAGGGADITARAIAQRLTEPLGQQIVVDNRPGVAGMLANQLTNRAPADGYTALLQPGSFVTISAHLNSKAPFDPTKQLTPVIQVSTYDFVMVVHPSVPARNLKEFIALARAKPKALTFASTGVGSNFHLAGEMLKLRTGIEMWHVPYKGTPAALVDVLSGRAEVLFSHLISVNEYIRNGRLRALAVTGARRMPQLPDVPTVAEAGVAGYELTGWEGILAPPGLPSDIVNRLNAAIAAVLVQPEMRDLWNAKGQQYLPNTPEQFTAKVREDYERTGDVIRAAGIKAEVQ